MFPLTGQIQHLVGTLYTLAKQLFKDLVCRRSLGRLAVVQDNVMHVAFVARLNDGFVLMS